MSYMIANLEDVSGKQNLSLMKSGNEYTVLIHNDETHENHSMRYKELNEAVKTFQKITEAILTGCYTFNDRSAMLYN